MLHPGKLPGDLDHDLRRDEAPQGGAGRHVVFHVVHPGDADVRDVHNGFAVVQHLSVFQPDAAGHGQAVLGEKPHLARCFFRQGAGDLVVIVQHHHIPPALMLENIALGLHILCHVPVDIQVIGAEIGDHRDVGGRFHGHQLEGGQLQHGHVAGLHASRLVQQGRADVAPQPNGFARRPEHLRDDGGGGGLAVAAGDGDHRAGTHLKKDLHLRGQPGPLFHGGQQAGMVGPQAGGAEHHISADALHIVLAQHQLHAPFPEPGHDVAQLFFGFPVSGSDLCPRAGQQPQQRAVGHADADDGDPLATQARQICFQCQIHRLQARISVPIIPQPAPVCNRKRDGLSAVS